MRSAPRQLRGQARSSRPMVGTRPIEIIQCWRRPCGSTASDAFARISRPHVAATGLELFFNQVLQRVIFHRHLGVHAFELAVLRFQFPISAQLRHTQTTEFRFPFVVTRCSMLPRFPTYDWSTFWGSLRQVLAKKWVAATRGALWMEGGPGRPSAASDLWLICSNPCGT